MFNYERKMPLFRWEYGKIMPMITDLKATPTQLEKDKLCQLGLAVIKTEAEAIAALRSRIDDKFALACQHLLACRGRIVVMGMGKSGHIGGKIAATLASTGSPAFFVHPGEASHGDMGMITINDVVLAISYSGKTDEITTLLPLIKRLGVPLISLTGAPDSPLARAATVHIDTSVSKEACPLQLAPTASTTAALAMGDALAIALLEARGFTTEDFALSHPGGSLGRRLLLHIDDIMHDGDAVPKVSLNASLQETLLEMTQKGLGMTAVTDENNKLVGVFTDGDLRRVFDQNVDLHSAQIEQLMTKNCITVQAGLLAAEALHIMQKNKINALVVVDAQQAVIGALNTHDLLRAGVI